MNHVSIPSTNELKGSKMALKKKLKHRRDNEERGAGVSSTYVAVEGKGNNESVLTAVDTLLNLGSCLNSA